jgi:hypothetical protein
MSIDSVVRDAVRSLYHPAEKPYRFNSIERQEHAEACRLTAGQKSKSKSAQTKGSSNAEAQSSSITSNISYGVTSTQSQASSVESSTSHDRTRTPVARPSAASHTTEEIDWAETSPIQTSSTVHNKTPGREGVSTRRGQAGDQVASGSRSVMSREGTIGQTAERE